MKTYLFVLLILLVACIASCGTTPDKTNTPGAAANQKQDLLSLTQLNRVAADSVSSAVNENDKDEVYQNGQQPYLDWDKKIIKTADIQSESKDYKIYNQQLHHLIKHYGGWTAAEDETQEPYKLSNRISIKVPINQFEAMVQAITGLDGKLVEKKISSEDVTGQVVDARGRIEAKKQVRERYMELLKQAKTMEDILKVQEEINGIHEELELTSTRLESLQHQSAYSTININFFQWVNGEAPKPDGEFSFGSRLVNALENGARWLMELTIGLLSIWPLLIASILFYMYIRRKNFLKTTTVKAKTDNK